MILHYLFLVMLGMFVDGLISVLLPKPEELKGSGVVIVLFAVVIAVTTLAREYGTAAFFFGALVHIILQVLFVTNWTWRHQAIITAVYALLAGVLYLAGMLTPW